MTWQVTPARTPDGRRASGRAVATAPGVAVRRWDGPGGRSPSPCGPRWPGPPVARSRRLGGRSARVMYVLAAPWPSGRCTCRDRGRCARARCPHGAEATTRNGPPADAAADENACSLRVRNGGPAVNPRPRGHLIRHRGTGAAHPQRIEFSDDAAVPGMNHLGAPMNIPRHGGRAPPGKAPAEAPPRLVPPRDRPRIRLTARDTAATSGGTPGAGYGEPPRHRLRAGPAGRLRAGRPFGPRHGRRGRKSGIRCPGNDRPRGIRPTSPFRECESFTSGNRGAGGSSYPAPAIGLGRHSVARDANRGAG